MFSNRNNKFLGSPRWRMRTLMPFTSNLFSGLKHMNTISLKGLVLKCYFKFQRKEMEFFHSKWVPPGISNLFPISVNICSNWRPGWREQRFPYCACASEYQSHWWQFTFVNMAAARERRVPKRYPDEVFSTRLLFKKKTRTKTNDRKLSSCPCDSRRQSRKASQIYHFGIYGIFFSLWYLQLLSVSSSPSSSSCRLVVSFCKDSSSARFQ